MIAQKKLRITRLLGYQATSLFFLFLVSYLKPKKQQISLEVPLIDLKGSSICHVLNLLDTFLLALILYVYGTNISPKAYIYLISRSIYLLILHPSSLFTSPFSNSIFSIGSSKLKIEPLPKVLLTDILLLCPSRICLTMASPKPVPPFSLDRLFSTR
jgi:hypothetical protein